MVTSRTVGQIWDSLGHTERIRIAECGLSGSSNEIILGEKIGDSEFISQDWKDLIPRERAIIIKGVKACGMK